MPAKRKTTTERRATWKGELQFGLVSFSVEAINAISRQDSDIHFHQLHAKCHSRIHYEKICPIHGPVSKDEIVMGYEYEKDHYVEITPEQLDALRTHDERALKIDSFVKPDVIDPVYFDGRMYCLVPGDKAAEQAYGVMVAAMEEEDCYGVGQMVFSGKLQLALIRPLKHLLHLAMLNYAPEIKLPERPVTNSRKNAQWEKQLKLAKTLIHDWTSDDFDFASYEDSYHESVEKLIKSKMKGKKVVVPKEEKRPATISLMDALKKSLQREDRKKRPTPAKGRARR